MYVNIDGNNREQLFHVNGILFAQVIGQNKDQGPIKHTHKGPITVADSSDSNRWMYRALGECDVGKGSIMVFDEQR